MRREPDDDRDEPTDDDISAAAESFCTFDFSNDICEMCEISTAPADSPPPKPRRDRGISGDTMEDNDSTRELMRTIDRLVAELDRLVAERDASWRRESELGLQVVAQAARLRLADTLAASVRCSCIGDKNLLAWAKAMRAKFDSVDVATNCENQNSDGDE